MGSKLLEDAIDQVLKWKCETQTIEVKASTGGTPKLYDTLSSFSNQASGGVIILGIDEKSGFKVVGVHNAQEAQTDIVDQCREMQPPVEPEIEVTERDGQLVVGIIIKGAPMKLKPVFRKKAGKANGSFVRIGAEDQRMTHGELYEIESFQDGTHDDRSVDPESTHDLLDEAAVAAYVMRAKQDRPMLARRTGREVLALTGVEKNGAPTLAGLMSLSPYPQQVYPNLCLTAVAVNGTTISGRPDGERFLDSKRFEGPIGQMIDDGVAFVRRNTRSGITVKDGKRADVAEYPETAVREVIANSLMHRDFGPYGCGSPVRLEIYSDRIVCRNPGGLYGGQGVDALGYEDIATRNPTLVSILETVGVAENRHSGIPVIRDEMERAGLPAPEFIDRHGSFVAVLRNRRDDDEASSVKGAGSRTPPTRDAVLDYCAVPRSRKDLAEHFGVGSAYLFARFVRPLLESGELSMTKPEVPKSKNQRYVAAKAAGRRETQQ